MRAENREPCENHGRLPPLCSCSGLIKIIDLSLGRPEKAFQTVCIKSQRHKSGDLLEVDRMMTADNCHIEVLSVWENGRMPFGMRSFVKGTSAVSVLMEL